MFINMHEYKAIIIIINKVSSVLVCTTWSLIIVLIII